jgi:hypothetical protein
MCCNLLEGRFDTETTQCMTTRWNFTEAHDLCLATTDAWFVCYDPLTGNYYDSFGVHGYRAMYKVRIKGYPAATIVAMVVVPILVLLIAGITLFVLLRRRRRRRAAEQQEQEEEQQEQMEQMLQKRLSQVSSVSSDGCPFIVPPPKNPSDAESAEMGIAR